jgi:hypothetical protein
VSGETGSDPDPFLCPGSLTCNETEHLLPTIADDASVELEAYWEPCKRSRYGLFDQTPVLREPRPAAKKATYTATQLRPFLPEREVSVGEVWKIDPGAALPLLSQFHPSASARMGGLAVSGAFGCLLAVGESELEILFRTHA